MSKKIIFTDNTNDLLKQYFKDINRYKIYSPDELAKLILAAREGDKIAKDKAITSNLKFVVSIAKQFQNRGVPLMDLISEGNRGLVKAVEKFKPEKNVPFLSFATWWIKKEIYNSIYWEGKSIRLPVSQQLIVLKIIKASQALSKELNRTPNNVEIAEYADLNISDVDRLMKYHNKLISCDEYINGDEESNQICDVITNPEEVLPDEEVNNTFVSNELKKILPLLPIREHDVVMMVFGIDMPKVNKKLICKMYNVSYERIRQIKESALKRLRTVHKNKLQKLL